MLIAFVYVGLLPAIVKEKGEDRLYYLLAPLLYPVLLLFPVVFMGKVKLLYNKINQNNTLKRILEF